MQIYLLLFNLLLLHVSSNSDIDELEITFGHTWDKREETLTIYFDISNSSMMHFRYYFYDFRPFASYDSRESYPRQRLIDTHNSLKIIGLHDNDYVSCVSLIDEYENIYKPRSACYEFTIGEKTIGSHHGGSSGYLAPLLLAVAFVIHVLIAVIHHIKAKNYAGRLLDRFINVDSKPVVNVKHSLKQLDQPYVSACVQRRLSRVSIANEETSGNNNYNSNSIRKKSLDEIPIYAVPHVNRKVSVGIMKTIPEYNP